MKSATKIINVVIDGVKSQMSFLEIEKLAKEKGVPNYFNMGNQVGGFSSGRDIETFAYNFTMKFYPNFNELTFKLNVSHYGIDLWDIPSLTMNDLKLITQH